MDLGLKNKTAIVLGASGGLGRCCAEMLAAEGVNLIICSKTYDKIFAAARSISETFGADVVPIAADISLPETPDKLVGEALRKFSSIDILINNTGISSAGKFDDSDEKELERSFNTSLITSIRMAQSVLPHMTSKGWGRIINITSSGTNSHFPGTVFASSLKTAVIDLSRTLSMEFSSNGVLVNTVLTGTFDTESFRAQLKKDAKKTGRSEKTVKREIESALPIGRIGNLEELAWLITFLAGERSSYITGTTIHVG
ncbi:SDR family oxidoreductase [Candidatus Latescibacterota bacterium]